MAEKQQVQIVYKRGSEHSLTGLGIFFLVLGIVVVALVLIVAGFSDGPTWKPESITLIQLLVGASFLVLGIALFIILRAGADIIRLLKKLNQINHCGEISEPRTEIMFKCPECGREVGKAATECGNCGEKFE